jgi:hypothetical protein
MAIALLLLDSGQAASLPIKVDPVRITARWAVRTTASGRLAILKPAAKEAVNVNN